MAQLMQPIDRQIMMCDSREETLMLACVMLHSAKTIMEAHVGKSGRRAIFTLDLDRKEDE